MNRRYLEQEPPLLRARTDEISARPSILEHKPPILEQEHYKDITKRLPERRNSLLFKINGRVGQYVGVWSRLA